MSSFRDRKRCAFTKEETMLIINLWKDDKIQSKFKSTLKHNLIWEQLSRDLAHFGYNKTGDEIKRKIQNLKHEYKMMKQTSVSTLKSWSYYDILKDLLEPKIIASVEDHNYIENEAQEIEEQSSTGSWMLMDITQSSNPIEIKDGDEEDEDETIKINTITVENLEESNNIIIEKAKVHHPQVKVQPIRKRRPLRFKTYPRSPLYSRDSEPRQMEHIDEREKRINEREVRLEERERRLDGRECRIDERERRVEEWERRLRERERRFEDRESKYDERESNSTTAMCRFFDTCAQFLNQYTHTTAQENCNASQTF